MSLLEEGLVGILDSGRWRSVASAPIVGRFRASRLYGRLNHRRRRLIGYWQARELPIDQIEVCVFLIGHTKSGGSLLGACLDAHPDVVIADEMGIPQHVASGFSRDEIVGLAVRNSRREALKDRVTARRIEAYSLAIPGGHQGAFRRLQVVGDTNAGPTTRVLGADPTILDRLTGEFEPIQIRVVHIARDPRGPVAAMHARSGRSVDDGIADYADQCRRLELLRSAIPEHRLMTVRYEDLVAAPREVLQAVADFVGVDSPNRWLDGCDALIEPTSTAEPNWTVDQLAAMDRLVASHPWLAS